MKTIVAGLVAALLGFSSSSAAEPVKVMIVGVFHMGNPGHDLHNTTVDDMLSPRRQAEIEQVSRGLTAFHPTRIAVEWPADIAGERYAKYLAGTLPPSRNEVVQLGFRLAKANGVAQVDGIDVDGDFPFEPVQAFAKAHGQQALLDDAGADVDRSIKAEEAVLQSGGVGAALRYLNEPARIAAGQDFYRLTLKIGSGATQPGADLLTAWYRRNFLICANLLQGTKPGDHVVVFYGSGHAFLLRQCIAETPGFQLVEPNAYLPHGKGEAAVGAGAGKTR